MAGRKATATARLTCTEEKKLKIPRKHIELQKWKVVCKDIPFEKLYKAYRYNLNALNDYGIFLIEFDVTQDLACVITTCMPRHLGWVPELNKWSVLRF